MVRVSNPKPDLQASWVTFKGVASRRALLEEALRSEVFIYLPTATETHHTLVVEMMVAERTRTPNPNPNPKPPPNPNPFPIPDPNPNPDPKPNQVAEQLVLAQRFPSVQTLP